MTGTTNERLPGKTTGHIYCYDSQKEKFILYSKEEGLSAFFSGVTQYNNYIFTHGGRDIENNSLADFKIFCIKENKWLDIKPSFF